MNEQYEIERVAHRINLFIAHVSKRGTFDLEEQDNLAKYLVTSKDEPIGTTKRFEIDRDALPDLVEETFPKGVCAERGKALVLVGSLCIANPIKPKDYKEI